MTNFAPHFNIMLFENFHLDFGFQPPPSMNLNYRITGPQSIERLTPLLSKVSETAIWNHISSPSAKLDFVWETACEKAMTVSHKSATVLNRLSNTQIIEDKANLAFLQLRMNVPVLESFIACSPGDVMNWSIARWESTNSGNSECTSVETVFVAAAIDHTWWAVKAARGNGGKDVWIMNRHNFREITAQLPSNDEFVIQKYVESPMLWNGKKKFHFRCYGSLHGDLSALVYHAAYVLTASSDFDTDGTENLKHITNLSVNKATPNHPGQIPCNLVEDFPQLFDKICRIWSSLASAAVPFMSIQRSANHFEFFGIDIIADSFGECWLIEANRLPGLESSNNNKEVEDAFYDTMMLSFLRIVLAPLLPTPRSDDTLTSVSSLQVSEIESAVTSQYESIHDGWVRVKPAAEPTLLTIGADAPTFKNLFSWRLFTRSHKNDIVLNYPK